MGRVSGETLLEIGKADLGFAPCAQHGLQRLGLFLDFEFDEIHRALERDALGFQVDLPGNAGAREIFAAFGDRQADLFGQACDFRIELFAPPGETEFLGARFAEGMAGLFGAGVDFADRLFDQRDLVAALRAVDGFAGDGGEQPPHSCKDAFMNHGPLRRLS